MQNQFLEVPIFNTDAEITGNTMTNMVNGIRVAWAANGNVGTPNTINIADNNITINNTPNSNNTPWGNQFFLYKYGINCVWNPQANINISHNTINLPVAQSVTGQSCFGVKLEEFSNNNINGPITVNNTNHVTGGDIAYHLNNITGAMIDGNEAINNPNGLNYAGFWLDDSPNNWLQCNNVDGSNTQYSTRGYRLNISTGNILYTNKVANTFRGIEASGVCDMPGSIAANVVQNNFLGLVVRDNGRIGIQGFTLFGTDITFGNIFTGNFADLLSYYSFPPAADLYYYNTLTNPNLPASNLALPVPPLSIPITIHQANSNVMIDPSPDCQPFNFLVAPGTNEQQINQAKQEQELGLMLQTVQEMPNENALYAEVMQYIKERSTYEKITNDTTLLQQTALASFYDTKKEDNLGKQIELERQLIEAARYSASSEFDENLYEQEKNAKLQNIVNEKQEFVPQNMMEANWEKVLSFYIELLQNGTTTLDDAAINTLYNIAVLCPYTAGPAVYQARAMLNALDLGVWANDEELCENLAFKTEQENPLKELAKKGWKREYSFKVFPNPAQEHLNMVYLSGDNENLSITVTNMLGQDVLSNKSLSVYGADVLNVSTLSNGIYFLKIQQNGQHLETKKFLIEK